MFADIYVTIGGMITDHVVSMVLLFIVASNSMFMAFCQNFHLPLGIDSQFAYWLLTSRERHVGTIFTKLSRSDGRVEKSGYRHTQTHTQRDAAASYSRELGIS